LGRDPNAASTPPLALVTQVAVFGVLSGNVGWDGGSSMGKIKKSIDINAAGDVVFDLLTDLDRLPQWSTITVETHGTPRQPIEEGDTFVQTLRILGQAVETQWRVVELKRPRKLAYETTAPGGGRMQMKQSVPDSAGVRRSSSRSTTTCRRTSLLRWRRRWPSDATSASSSTRCTTLGTWPRRGRAADVAARREEERWSSSFGRQ
jgi:uncharacterized protein YndB with AHSA1/START domain